MVFSSWSGLCLLIFFPVLVCALPFLASPLPHEVSHWKATEIPIQQRKVGNDVKRRALVGTAGLGDVADL